METYYFFIYYENNLKSWTYGNLQDCLSEAIDDFNTNKKEVAVYSFDIDEDDEISKKMLEDVKDGVSLGECEHIITINERTYHTAVKILDYI